MITKTYHTQSENSVSLEKKRSAETGFPSPATDHLEDRLNLHSHLIRRPASTFFSKVKGNEGTRIGVSDGDLLIVDRSLAPKQNSLVLAVIDDEFRVCRLHSRRDRWMLQTGNGERAILEFDEEARAFIWGKITHVIHACD